MTTNAIHCGQKEGVYVAPVGGRLIGSSRGPMTLCEAESVSRDDSAGERIVRCLIPDSRQWLDRVSLIDSRRQAEQRGHGKNDAKIL